MNLDLGSGYHLVLAGGGKSVIWLAGGLVAIVLLLALYRYEMCLVPRRFGIALLFTRLLAALFLIGSLFEPIAALKHDELIKGRVILGVDLSRSMATADPIPFPRDRPRQSASDPVPTIKRYDVASRLLQGEWIKKLATVHHVEPSRFSRTTAESELEKLAAAKPDISADSLLTDWNPVLGRALQGTGTAPVLGVVLLTDGRQNAPADPARSAEKLAALGIPVFSVLIGSTTPPKDVAIAAVKAPETVLKGDLASVEVTLKLDGIPGVDVPVVLERAGLAPLKQIVRGQPDGARPVATFRVPMETVGTQNLTISVGPLIGDARPENDRRSVAVQVADDKARVLLVDGEPRWEFRYLQTALARDPRVSVATVVFRQPVAAAGTPSHPRKLPERGKPTDPDPLGAFEAILIGDVDATMMPAEAWGRIEEFVGKRGGTLILSPGRKGWTNSSPALDSMGRLMPVTNPTPIKVDRSAADPAHPSLIPGVSIVPATTASIVSWPMLQLAAPEQNTRLWSRLPRLPWVLGGRAKPGAAVLAVAAGGDSSDEQAIIAAQSFGLGKVLWVGTDSTWRWRFRAGDTHHHRFWGQVMRWAAAGKLAGGNDLVRFGPERPRIEAGESARLQARFADAAGPIGKDFLAVARVFNAHSAAAGSSVGEAVAMVPLTAVAGQPRTFAATTPTLSAGRYVIRLDAPSVAPVEAALEVTEPISSELVELSASRDALDGLAAATGGRVFTPEEVDQIPALLDARATVKTRVEETPLWDQPWTLAIFFTLLTVEWIIRKRAGLP
jgi:hypothetical protein